MANPSQTISGVNPNAIASVKNNDCCGHVAAIAAIIALATAIFSLLTASSLFSFLSPQLLGGTTNACVIMVACTSFTFLFGAFLYIRQFRGGSTIQAPLAESTTKKASLPS